MIRLEDTTGCTLVKGVSIHPVRCGLTKTFTDLQIYFKDKKCWLDGNRQKANNVFFIPIHMG